MKRLFLCFVILLADFVAWAQQGTFAPEVAPLPKGPLLAFAPEYSSWVTICGDASLLSKKGSLSSSGKAEPKAVRRVQTIKAGPVRYILTIGINGQRSEIWRKGDLQIFKGAEWGGKPLVTNVRNIRRPLDFSKTDFPECAWISDTYYQGVRKVLDRDCMVFTKMAGNSQPSSEPKTGDASEERYKGKLQACIDLQTLLPVLLVEGDAVTIYEFALVPPTMLTFPVDVQAAIEEKRIAVEKLTSRPPRPF